MPGFRSAVGVILAATMFSPIGRVVWIALHYMTGRAERWGQSLGYLATDLLQDLWFLVIFGLLTIPLWILNAFILGYFRRRQVESWWIAALSGVCVGLIWSLWPCGFHVFREFVGAGIYSTCLPGFSIVSPGVEWGGAGCLTGLLYFWVWHGAIKKGHQDGKQASVS